MRALHQELAAEHITVVVVAREHHVTQLLLGPEVIKEGLADVLHHKLIQEALPDLALVSWALVVGQHARILILFVIEGDLEQVACTLGKAHRLHLPDVLNWHVGKAKLGLDILNELDGCLMVVVAADEPDISSFFQPASKLSHEILIGVPLENISEQLLLDCRCVDSVGELLKSLLIALDEVAIFPLDHQFLLHLLKNLLQIL